MFRAILGLVGVALPLSLAAQQQPRGASSSPGAAGREGDTVDVVVVQIRANRQTDYERWLREVVTPAIARAGQRFPSARAYWATAEYLAPARRTNDSTVTYMYLIDYAKLDAAGVKREAGRSTKVGWRALFEDAGMPPAEIERELAASRAMHSGQAGYTFVRWRPPTP